MYPYLASSTNEGSVAAVSPLFTGPADIITDSAPALAAITQWQLCVLLATGITPYVPATHTTAAPDKLVIAQHAAASGVQCNYYLGGEINHNLVTWPAAVNTYALRKELMLGSMLKIGHAKPPSA